jgi:rod shape-determining protein MreD
MEARVNSHRLTYIAFGFAAYLLVFVMARYDGIRLLLGAQIDFLPGLVVVAAMMYGIPAVLVVSITGGMLYDCLSANPMGTTTFALTIVGAFVYFNRDLLLKDQTYPQFILGAGASAAAPILSYVAVSVLGAHPLIEWPSLWVWLIMTLGGALATPVWFVIFRRVDKALHYQMAPESVYRADREIERGKT